MGIKENLEKIESEIGNAKLLIITKLRSEAEIRELINLGYNEFGENKIQELEKRAEKFPGVTWHMVGHVQSNKAGKAVELCEVIHSVDSLKLARKIDSAAKEIGKVQRIFVEVNVAGEESKYGISENELEHLIDEIKRMKNIELLGLMTMAPFIEAEETRKYFRKLKQLAGRFGLKGLSMGMSNDYRQAVSEGATLLRIGTAVFEG